MGTLIGIGLFVPSKRSERPKLKRLWCELEDPQTCPILQRGECIHQQFLGGGCPYGRYTQTTGWTRRARKYGAWLRNARETRDAGPGWPESPKRHLAVVGEYVWLPYAQMANNESLPFLAHSGPFRLGKPFMKLEDFTPEAIVSIVRFRPYALMGGEITSYQGESVPQFLYDLKHTMPDLYAQAADLDSSIREKSPDFEQFKRSLVEIKHVSPNTTVRIPVSNRYSITAVWDGVGLSTQSKMGRIVFWPKNWGADEDTEAELKYIPKDSLEVYVDDEQELRRLYHAGAFTER
jgi:hypothetical protein